MKIAVFNAIRGLERFESGNGRLRLFDELKLSAISNLQVPSSPRSPYQSDDHPFDLVVGYPLEIGKDVWDLVPAYGLIELKRNFEKDYEDAHALGAIAEAVRKHARNPPVHELRWVLLVVLVNGPPGRIATIFKERTQIAEKHGLGLLCGGKEAQDSGLGQDDSHFDVLCFGVNV